MDEFAVAIPRDALAAQSPDKPEDGGFDVCCPTDEMSMHQVSSDMISALSQKGYCLVQMPENKDMLESLQQELRWYKSDFIALPPEFEAYYLGHEASSKVLWLQGKSPELQELEGTGIGYHMNCVSDIGSLLSNHAQEALDFNPAPSVGSLMLRKNFTDTKESTSLSRGNLTTEEKQDGAVEEFLDFIQRRKLCCVYFIACEGQVELISRTPVNSLKKVTLPALTGKLLIFRQDLLSCSSEKIGEHLVMQGWVLSEQKHLSIQEVTGSEDQIRALSGATAQFNQPMGREDDIHFVSLACKTGGGAYGGDATSNMYVAMCDPFIKIPLVRWDHDAIVASVDNGWGICQHSGMVLDEMMFNWDNEFFGVSDEDASRLSATTYMETESVTEVLYSAGLTKETVRGQPINLYGASQGKEGDMAIRFGSVGNQIWSDHYTPPMIIAYLMGLQGAVHFIDTACSSTNVAVNIAYHDMRIRRDVRKFHRTGVATEAYTDSVITGSMYSNAPGAFVGLSAAHMLGIVGRSMTFDNSANGYARGEGVGTVFLKNDQTLECKYNSLADMIGGFINQDGRSASLTAPSGPSQTAVIMGALKDVGGRAANTISITEMHGTGTALGDPVETGSVKAALNRDRFNPLVYQAGKAVTGHLEHAAGVTGIIKTIRATMLSVGYSQCHLRELNGNIDERGYPALWPTETLDLGLEWIHAGISSFGFGGTNVRTQIWNHAKLGARKVADVGKHPDTDGLVVAKPVQANIRKFDLDKFDCMLTSCPQCFGKMCWLCGEADDVITPGKHVCTQIREDISSYDICSGCYKGGYSIGNRAVATAGIAGRIPYIFGSWSKWNKVEEMQQTEEGAHVYAVRLGSSCSENFQIFLDQDPNQRLYPIKDKARANVKVVGPDAGSKGRRWQIDGSEGTLYRIQLDWGSDIKSVGWEAVVTAEQTQALHKVLGDKVFSQAAKQRAPWAIVGSFNEWSSGEMTQSAHDQHLWEASFQIGVLAKEEFQILNTGNYSEAIYPAGFRVVDSSVPIRGPDDKGHGKNWLIMGATTEVVKVQLRVSEGDVTLTTMCGGRERTWHSKVKPRYYIIGSWTDWKFDAGDKFELQPDPYHPRRYKCTLCLQKSSEEFQIAIDKDWSRIFHPPKDYWKSDVVKGPDDEGHGCNWVLDGRAGAPVQIILDLSSETKGPMVSFDWR